MGLCTISSSFLHFHAFSMYFSKFYPSPSFSNGFCTISSCCCYHIFLHFDCIFHHFPVDVARFPLIVIMFFCDGYHVFLQFHCIFQYILMVSTATKKAGLGGIDTPPSANYLVVHTRQNTPFSRAQHRGTARFWFPFVNHPTPTPPILTSFANSN